MEPEPSSSTLTAVTNKLRGHKVFLSYARAPDFSKIPLAQRLFIGYKVLASCYT
jgi:hypothetical protein